ncbi:bifunctional adenosylcobinamide kinase/adenosylcobinamide-phosphate guanylyltransferase [Lachnoclostridium phytofermentans]|uniref:Cobalamin biosynthesis protein CobU, putative, truncation n=1 Tax=Lachnoclostridium phytofermentans (strain ATCC 700394 / DSM 18823 / ISDg) TaxID=357809 RepID=A9KMP1_LACP7|nr:bifunctional adenosylcobinamide kinase/adenosylcobinamide-phosphate guanylyltransferase [Lachnoclostridium phytofermentans]ABX41486.1 cobalamin biosynthesis protein CobU, putative, truncation [Lachnoclostridium phytofermentans ISDg]
MELVIGGRASGKLEYTMKVSGLAIDAVAESVIDETKQILNSLQDTIREWMKEDYSSLSDEEMITKYLGRLHGYIKKNPNCFIICDEVGLGVVPLEAIERSYREVVGRVLCELAKLSKKVHRVYYGIGAIIKDETNCTH